MYELSITSGTESMLVEVDCLDALTEGLRDGIVRVLVPGCPVKWVVRQPSVDEIVGDITINVVADDLTFRVDEHVQRVREILLVAASSPVEPSLGDGSN